MTRKWIGAAAAAGAIGLVLGACDDLPVVPVDDTSEIRLELTGGEARYLSAAEVDIGAIELIGVEDTVQITLTADATSGPVDLVALSGGATIDLAELDIPPGDYARLRLVLESASVELEPGYTFADGTTSRTLTVPTGASSGLLLNLEPAAPDDTIPDGLQIEREGIELMLAFHTRQSFPIVGDPDDPDGIAGITFTPAIRVVEAMAAGSISGTVISLTPEDIDVRAFPLDEASLQPYQTLGSTAITAANGSYELDFLTPGEYAVDVIVGPGFTTVPAIEQITVGPGEGVTNVDFQVVAD